MKKILLLNRDPSHYISQFKDKNWDIQPVDETRLFSGLPFEADLIMGDFFGADKRHDTLSFLLNQEWSENTPKILSVNSSDVAWVISEMNGYIDDYLVEPYTNEEVFGRAVRVLARFEKFKGLNPLSGLPGNNMIRDKMAELIRLEQTFCVIYVDIDHFKSYNDVYGYFQGDEIIQYTARILKGIVREHKHLHPVMFLGHIGGDDFLLIAPPGICEHLCKEIITRFDTGVDQFYSPKDRLSKGIVSKNRQGHTQFFPLMSLTLAVVMVDSKLQTTHLGEISMRCAEIKKYLKTQTGSHYLIDRRKLSPVRMNS